jgi:hypothetical protein
VAINGLVPGTGYSFTIFPYAWDGVNPQTTNYHTQSPVPFTFASTSIPLVTTYHWTGASGIDWTVAGNWNPARTIPALNDHLVFDVGGAWTIINVPTQTIGQMEVVSNTSVTLQGSGMLGIAGDSGDDLVVAPGCQLNISGSGTVSLSLAAGASGLVSGSVTFSGSGHRLLASQVSGVIFAAGSMFKTGSGFTGNPFGTSNLNSVVFSSGSTFISAAGSNPFGAAAPASVVVFQPGSLFRVDAYVVPSFGGRTYGNFEMNYPGLITATGSAAVIIDNFTASQGNFYFNMTGSPGHSIRGNITVASAATVIFNPSSAGTVQLNGTSHQTISGSGTLMAGSNSTLTVGNSSGVTLNKDATFNNLTIISGGVLTIAPNAKLTVNGNLINAGPASGLVIENDGSMIHHTAGVEGIVKRNFAAADWSDWHDGWHFLSSPVSGQEINTSGGFITTGSGNDFDLYSWLESDDQWVNVKNTSMPPLFSTINSGSDFLPGRGYLAAYEQSGTKLFTGSLNMADVPVSNLPVSGANPVHRGWHLLGNPYSSALIWFTGWETSNIGGVTYIWNEDGMSYTPRNPGEAIPSCNGFMVQVVENPENNGSLTIPASKRVHDAQSWFKDADYPVIRLFARNMDNPSFQECQVRFNPLSTRDFDPGSDGRFLPGYAPLFYSSCGPEKLAVNSVPRPEENMLIPFCFEKNEGGRFQIEARIFGGLSAVVTLVDKKTGTQQNITSDPVYGFTSDELDAPERFELRFSHVGVGEPPGQINKVYASGAKILVYHCGDVKVEVFSILGKLISYRTLSGSGIDKVEPGAPPGWYLVRLTAGQQNEVTKVFINSTYQ